MSWIPAVSKDQASPEVKRIYDFLDENWGFVPNYFLALVRAPQRTSRSQTLTVSAKRGGTMPQFWRPSLSFHSTLARTASPQESALSQTSSSRTIIKHLCQSTNRDSCRLAPDRGVNRERSGL